MNESTAGTQDCWGVTRDGLLVSAAIYLNAENSPEKIKKQRQTVCGEQPEQCQVSGGNMKLVRFQWSLLYETTLTQWQRPDTSVGNIRTTAPMQVPGARASRKPSFILFICFYAQIWEYPTTLTLKGKITPDTHYTKITTPETLRGLQLVQSAHSSLSRMETTAEAALWLPGGCEYIGTTAFKEYTLIYFIKQSVMCSVGSQAAGQKWSCANKQVSPVKMETVENDNPYMHKGKRSSWNSCGLKTTHNPV